MVAPIGLALATFLIIVCWSKCYKQDLQDTFGVPWKNLLLLCIFQPFVPFMKFFVVVNHRIPKVKKMFGKIMNVNEITDEYVEVWIMYFEAFWLFNVVGEAIPQLIISCLFISYKGEYEWRFHGFDRTNPAYFDNDMLLLSTSLSIFSMFNGTAVAIRSFIRIRECLNKMRELNQTTLCKTLKNEKECQDRPKMTVEYQQDFSEESATDALLERKQVVAHLFLDSLGNLKKMETAMLNGTVLKSTPEKTIMTENDGIHKHSYTSLKVAETGL